MTPRSIRRAAERKANKKARQAQRAQAALVPPQPEDPQRDRASEPSAARIDANRANAQHSTGPRTAEGKARVSLNALKTALTGCTVLLPADDAFAYERHILSYQEQFNPVGPEESALVQSLADIRWRLNRVPSLEYGLYTKGALEFADSFNDRPESERGSFIQIETLLKYEKQFRNLQLQETRLVRRREKEMAELRKLQEERKTREVEALDRAARRCLVARHLGESFDPAAFGFVFSTAEIERYLSDIPEPKKHALVAHELENFPRMHKTAA